MYTIKHAAEVTGLSPATLRAWERRYGVVTPHRTESGYRLYDEDAVRTLRGMAALVDQGWSPRQAAEETRRRSAEGGAAAPQVEYPGSVPSAGISDIPSPEMADSGLRRTASVPKATVDEADPDSPTTHAAGAPWPALPTVDDLVDAAAKLDVERLTAILDERFSLASFESVVDSWLMPSLVALGEAWASGRVSVAGEHLTAQAVMRRLAAAYDAASSGASGARVVVGTPPGCRHELGVLAFSAAARRAGLSATYLGADLPTADWVAAVVAHRARAVVLAVLQESDLRPLASVVEHLLAAQPDLLIAVGGALQARAPQPCLRLGHGIGAGAAMLAATLDAAGSR